MTEHVLSSTQSTQDALAGDKGIHVRETIQIDKPVAEVFRFWRLFENLPQFMTHLERVTDLGNGRSHWVAKGPANVNVEWDAEIINEIENEVISWASLPEPQVATAGSARFVPTGDSRSTDVSVNLQYDPPAGRVGAFIATLFRREASQTIREDLIHLKQLLETGAS